jgi:hypothetical protein
MEPRQLELLIRMVEDLDRELATYVAKSALPAGAIFHLLKACHQMRMKKLDSTVQYWLEALERHVAEMSNPRTSSEEVGSLSSSARLLSTELHVLKDVHNLCTLLMHSRGTIH